jgi:RNA polymerase sigma-70 factor (ECF subfamily)
MSSPDAECARPNRDQVWVTDRDLLDKLYSASGATKWNLSVSAFEAALRGSLERRFANESPSAVEIRRYLESLHLEDLALAVACREGSESAWDHFVTGFRPRLHAAARAIGGQVENARDLADSLYAELYGLSERRGERRSLLAYFHGRSSLLTWLRSVLAQRYVDRFRQSARYESLDMAVIDELPSTSAPAPVDPPRERYLALARRVVAETIAALENADRLRLAYYYAHGLKLAEIGRLMKEHESTVSRKLDRTRRQIKADVERSLGRDHGLTEAQITVCFEALMEAPYPDSVKVDALGIFQKRQDSGVESF